MPDITYVTPEDSVEIHLVRQEDGSLAIWLDTNAGEQDGLCLGIAEDPRTALLHALAAIKAAEAAIAHALVTIVVEDV